MASKREIKRAKKQRNQMISRLVWGALGLFVVGLLGFFVIGSARPEVGKAVPVAADIGHVEEGGDPGVYNTDPPTSGPHYADELEVGFYDPTALDTYGPYPEGYLVHNLEHGYVIFWYNCQLLNEQSCQNLKDQISNVMDEVNNFKVIAFPRPSIGTPVVMTSWGRILEFQEFDPDLAEQFVLRNRNQAPEPDAP